jgi:Uma2 family endonuclease
VASLPARVDPRFPNLRPEVAEGYLNAPEHVNAEVIDGELFLMSRPRPRHGRGAGQLLRWLGRFDDGDDGTRGSWVFLFEPELHLGGKPDIIDPDLAGWRRERMPEVPEEAAITLPPDWICEVISPSTEAIDRGKKMRVFRREGVGHVWLLSPELRTLEAYRLENGRYSLLDTHEGDATVRAEPFDAVELRLPVLWAR